MTNSNSSVTALVTCDLNVLQLLYLKSDTERKITKSIFHVRLKCLKLFEKVVAKMFIYHQKFFSLTYIEESYCSLLIIEYQTSSSCTWMEGNKCIISYWSQDTKTSPSFTWIQGYKCILMWKKKKRNTKMPSPCTWIEGNKCSSPMCEGNLPVHILGSRLTMLVTDTELTLHCSTTNC